MKTDVELEIDGDIGRIVLKPVPDTKPPAFDQRSIAALDETVARIEEKAHKLRIVVLASAAEKHFLVGANINALSELTAETISGWVREGHRVFNRLESLPLPVIARVEGNAIGGGLELAMACDFLLAGNAARFGLPEPRLGLITGWGGACRLARRIGIGKARELLYTGRLIRSAEAQEMGLCDLHGSLDELDAWMDRFVAHVRETSWESIAETKAMLLRFEDEGRQRAREWEASASERLMGSPTTLGLLKAFFEQRKSAT